MVDPGHMNPGEILAKVSTQTEHYACLAIFR